MTTLTWSPEALRDLESIRAFIAQDSERYADLVVRRLIRGVERLRSFPESGRVVPERNDLPEYLDLPISLATRPTETLRLKFSDVDWVNRQIAVRKTKNGKDRVLPLNDTALPALRTLEAKQHATSEYVFHRRDGRAWLDMRETFNQAARAAGL